MVHQFTFLHILRNTFKNPDTDCIVGKVNTEEPRFQLPEILFGFLSLSEFALKLFLFQTFAFLAFEPVVLGREVHRADISGTQDIFVEIAQ